MDCPKCAGEKKVKSGVIKGRQRYRCKECGCNYTVEIKSTGKPLSMKRQALQLYLEGLGFRSIGRFLNVSHVSVYEWIKSFGLNGKSLQLQEKNIEIVEIDEMHSYIGQKKYCWIWIAVDRLGKRFINFVIGDRSSKTGKKLWEKIKEFKMSKIATDHWSPYDNFVPEENHVRSKAETFTVEGYNSIFRHFLARMRRKSKCYSKSMEMLELSFLLLMKYRNNTLSIFS
ncbi:MAG: IS1 family transposase [Prevotella sp.]|nr:IS1 family transposase [Prevotella sp.]